MTVSFGVRKICIKALGPSTVFKKKRREKEKY
jgi:hypothetical protein